MTEDSIKCCAVKPDDWFCPIFKDICFKEMADPAYKVGSEPDRCPCGFFMLGNQESTVGGLL